MKTAFLSVLAMLFLLFPSRLCAQTWSAEEQAFLDYFNQIYDEIERHNEATFELWSETVKPREDLTWWFTNRGIPADLEAIKQFNQSWGRRNIEYTYLDIQPIEIKIIGRVAMIWYYGRGEGVDPSGTRQGWESKRLEIYEKQGEGWAFVGGMVTPVTPFE